MKTFLGVGVASLLIACGSGGSDPSTASSSGGSSSTSSSSGLPGTSSSGGSSNGGCEAICVGGARITVEEDNTGDRLDGATLTSCQNGTMCATGIIGKNSKGVFVGNLVKANDQNSSPNVQLAMTAPSAGILRIQVYWDFGQDGSKLVDGDTWTVSARDGDGPILFDRSFPATYRTETVCGSTCRVYEKNP